MALTRELLTGLVRKAEHLTTARLPKAQPGFGSLCFDEWTEDLNTVRTSSDAGGIVTSKLVIGMYAATGTRRAKKDPPSGRFYAVELQTPADLRIYLQETGEC